MMWKALTIQTVIFIALFQPRVLVFVWLRRAVFAVAVSLLVYSYVTTDWDPFAWMFTLAGLLLTYGTASKALRSFFAQRATAARESKRLGEIESNAGHELTHRDERIGSLQREIQRVSDIYENLKEMSGSTDYLGIFVNLAQIIVGNFSSAKVRVLFLNGEPGQHAVVDKVYQADAERLALQQEGQSVMTTELMFQGEVHPNDLKTAEHAEHGEKAVYYGTDPSGGMCLIERTVPPQTPVAMVCPVQPGTGVRAVLMVEGICRSEANDVLILKDRFASEFRRIDLYENVQQLATTDWLTGLYVRRYFFKRLEEEIGRSQRFHLMFSFLMIDIDDFKIRNDRYGHLVGDALLKKTARIIKQNVREIDLVGRFGGEEFAVILLDTDPNGAMFVGQRIRRSIEKECFRVYDEKIQLTVSVGMAMYMPGIEEGGQMVERADSALYQAKRQGKNRVCVYGAA